MESKRNEPMQAYFPASAALPLRWRRRALKPSVNASGRIFPIPSSNTIGRICLNSEIMPHSQRRHFLKLSGLIKELVDRKQ